MLFSLDVQSHPDIRYMNVTNKWFKLQLQYYCNFLILYTTLSVPLKAYLTRGNSTISSVSASWPSPEGVVQYYQIKCSNGTPSDSYITEVSWNKNSTAYTASCLNVSTPGDNYTMTVTSVSNKQHNLVDITLTACKDHILIRND